MSRRTVTSIGAWVAAFVLVVPAVPASEIGQEIADQVRLESYRHFLDTQLFTRIGDDRGYDSPQHDLARENIVTIFESYGLEVELHPFDYYGGTYYNIVATQTGTVYPDAQFILGAHYDSVFNPGADDDASGVAGLLEIARVLSAYEAEYTIKYIAFDIEEMGLVGSEAYVDDHLADDIRGMVQLDMIAWDWRTYKCVIHYIGSQSSAWAEQLEQAVEEYGGDLIVRYTTEGGGGSDHVPFGDVGMPACLLIENRYWENPSYHRRSDTVDNPGYLSYGYAIDMTRSAAGFLADQAGAYHPVDCDGDGIPDAEEIAIHPTLDCNGNHILDVCEFAGDQDLNENGVPDLCDIHDGTSGDCNGNWIPDEIESGYSEDCNGNGVPDLCDVATHGSEDLNRNGVPDECEIHGTIYVDDDAPGDPGPGDPDVSDPDEDGSAEHPFDSIMEAVALSVSDDEILARPGLYSGIGNRAVSFGGRRIAVRSEGGPDVCVIDLEGLDRAFVMQFRQGPESMLDGFTIVNGYAWYGGALDLDHASPTIVNCIFRCNVSERSGGAVYSSGGSPTFVNCVFSENESLYDGQFDGGAVHLYSASLLMKQCKFTRNSAARQAAALWLRSSSCTLGNCVLWDDRAPSGPEIGLSGTGTLMVSYSDVAGGLDQIYVTEHSDPTVIWGPGNIDADPLFADPNNGDWRLLPGSPCIDAGDNSTVPADMLDLDGDGDIDEPIPFDLDGNPRFVDDLGMPDCGNGTPPIVDMGAYEFQGETCFGDLDGDNSIGLTDLAALLSSYGTTSGAVYGDGDLDRDSDVDLTDLAALLGVYGTTCP